MRHIPYEQSHEAQHVWSYMPEGDWRPIQPENQETFSRFQDRIVGEIAKGLGVPESLLTTETTGPIGEIGSPAQSNPD